MVKSFMEKLLEKSATSISTFKKPIFILLLIVQIYNLKTISYPYSVLKCFFLPVAGTIYWTITQGNMSQYCEF